MITPLKYFHLGYFGIFSGLYSIFRSLGIVGELIFTFVGLIFLLWPMVIPYYADNKILYLPAVILTTYLCVQAKSSITK